jgi:hypothetical protein
MHADDARPPRWDGHTSFYEDDEPIENIRRIMARPPDAITGEEYDPTAVPGADGDVTPPM